MVKDIKRAVVLGSGLMGGGITALLASAGIEVLMLDIAPRELSESDKEAGLTLESKEFKNKIVQAGLDRILDPRSMILYDKSHAKKITIGNFSDDLEKIKDADWIIEVIIEKLEPKQAIMDQVAQYRKKGSIVSSNTSGIPVTWIVEKQDEEFKKHFLGTHFFNPVRFMKLLELIPTKDTSKEVLEFMNYVGETILGKGVVIAKDTPDFVANRIGGFAMIDAINHGIENDIDVTTLDLLTGPVIGRPKSGTYRLADLVGIDLMVYTGKNKIKNVPTEKERNQVALNPLLETMVSKGMLGDKSSQGFYKREVIDGKRVTLELDLKTLTYKEAEAPQIDCIKEALASDNKYRTIVAGECGESHFVWGILKTILVYSAERVPEIADDYKMIDKAMKWGYNWEKGPFEIWDELGVVETAKRMVDEGENLPKWVLDRVEKGLNFYDGKDKEDKYIKLEKGKYPLVDENMGADVLDIGDGVLLLEFKSKGNTISNAVVDMLEKSLEILKDPKWKGLVIGNNGKHFSIGADLREFFEDNMHGDAASIAKASGRLEDLLLKIKYSDKPIVSAPFGNTLGGGCEVAMHAPYSVIAPETYAGLVETGVGLVPGGGGLKEMLFKAVLALPEKTIDTMMPVVGKVFENVLKADLARSGFSAIEKGIITYNARVIMNQDALLSEAKATVLKNYLKHKTMEKRDIPVLGKVGISYFGKVIAKMIDDKVLSEHDGLIASKIVNIVCGGSVDPLTMKSEEDILMLERQAFGELAATEKTQERIIHMLKVGKPLRN